MPRFRYRPRDSYAPTLYNLFKTEDVVTECLKWSDFDVSSWAKNSGSSQISKVYTGEEAAKEIQSIMFRIQSRGDDEKKVFNIRGISTYDPSSATQYWWRPDDKFYERFPVDDTLTCLWKGGWDATHVNTGFNDRDEYAGMLSPFDASPGDAYAHIDFPAYPSMEYSPYMYESVIMECSGFCGTMDVNLEGSEYAVGGVSFSIAGYGDDEPNYENIQDWGGICVTYYSEKDVYLNFVVKGVAYESSPKVDLPKSNELVERCFTWNEIAPNDPDMGKAVGIIQFAAKSSVNYEKFKFNLAGIGKYSANGACAIEKPVITPKSSSSVWIRSSSSIDTTKNRKLYSEEQCIELSNLWSFFGYVETGYTNWADYKYAGRWYKIEDTSDEHKSNFIQPLTEEEFEGQNVIYNGGVGFPDSCAGSKRSDLHDYGVCGTAEFKDDYFAGFGFYVAGFDSKTDSLLSGDVKKSWGGICVTYASEADIDVVMNSTGVHDISQLPKLPKATLPKSSEVVTRCLPWSEFKSVADDRVITGLDNGTETSGYWFSFGDEESGNGKVVYPSTSGIDYTTTDQVFDYCMGVCGSLEFSKEGYLGVGFHVAGVVDPMDDNSLVAKANISSWGGLCVTYASESDLEVVLTYAQTSGFGDFSRMPKTTLPKSIELKR